MADDSAASISMMREIDARMRSRMQALEREVEAGKTRTRFLAIGLAVTLALLAIVAVFPDVLATAGVRSAAESIEVRRITLLGEGRSRRGEWSVDRDGNVRLSLLDQQGRPRLNLTVLDGGFPGLSLANAEGGRRAVLGLLPDGKSTLVFADQTGLPRAVFGLDPSLDAASMVLADANGVSRVGLGLDGTGVGSVMLPEGETGAGGS
jgi:hypothetical protein